MDYYFLYLSKCHMPEVFDERILFCLEQLNIEYTYPLYLFICNLSIFTLDKNENNKCQDEFSIICYTT